MGFQVNEIYQSNSDHLKSEDIGNDMPTYTISGVEQKQFDNGDLKLVVLFQEIDKSLVLNKTNADAIAVMYGFDTDAWIGNRIMLFTMQVEYQGRQTMGLRVRAPMSQNAAAVQNAVNSGVMDPNVPPATDPNQYGAAR